MGKGGGEGVRRYDNPPYARRLRACSVWLPTYSCLHPLARERHSILFIFVFGQNLWLLAGQRFTAFAFNPLSFGTAANREGLTCSRANCIHIFFFTFVFSWLDSVSFGTAAN